MKCVIPGGSGQVGTILARTLHSAEHDVVVLSRNPEERLGVRHGGTRGVPVAWPATEWMLKPGAMVMRTDVELILKSRRVISGRLMKDGFTFEFPEWDAAAKDLVARRR